WISLFNNEPLVFTIDYQVSDGNGGFDISHQTITINGVNDPPTDGNEIYTFNEDAVENTTTLVTPTKLANASDPDGDPVHIDVFGSANVNLGAEFSIIQSGTSGVYTLTYLANPSD